MAERPLTADEAALWRRVMDSVRPIPKRVAAKPKVTKAAPASLAPKAIKTPPDLDLRAALLEKAWKEPSGRARVESLAPVRPAANTLDGSWDRQLLRGTVSPDSSIDLHGHSLQSAYGLLDEGLSRAISRGDRVLLLVTGKPPRAESERPHARGAIRAAVGDWLASSRHSANIAAVRGAHPRHGGTGALYIVLRRQKALSPPKY
ncbi:Smr/MutS family protein [soil metagenome]